MQSWESKIAVLASIPISRYTARSSCRCGGCNVREAIEPRRNAARRLTAAIIFDVEGAGRAGEREKDKDLSRKSRNHGRTRARLAAAVKSDWPRTGQFGGLRVFVAPFFTRARSRGSSLFLSSRSCAVTRGFLPPKGNTPK